VLARRPRRHTRITKRAAVSFGWMALPSLPPRRGSATPSGMPAAPGQTGDAREWALAWGVPAGRWLSWIEKGKSMAGLYFEEFHAGQKFVHPWSRTVTEMDNTLFSLLTMNPQPLHLDAHFAAQTEWGQRLFNSLYTLGILVGMTVNDTTLGTTWPTWA
jgi:hypothetical protein